MKKKKKKEPKNPKVNKELDGFNIEIDPFGELQSNLPIEKLNEFLNKNVDDKKLEERSDYKDIQKKGSFKKDEEKDDQ